MDMKALLEDADFIADCRDWVADVYANEEMLTDIEVMRYIRLHYDGGTPGFLADRADFMVRHHTKPQLVLEVERQAEPEKGKRVPRFSENAQQPMQRARVTHPYRSGSECCQKSIQGCSIDHDAEYTQGFLDSECETW